MIVTSKRGFAEWETSTAIPSSPPRSAIDCFIRPLSFKSKAGAIDYAGTVDLLPEVIRLKTTATANPIPTLKRRGRPPKNGGADHADG